MSLQPTLLALLYLGYTLIPLILAQNDRACPAPAGQGAQSTCTCQTDSGLTIDLRPLAKSDGTAKYVVLFNTSSDILIHNKTVIIYSYTVKVCHY